MSFKLKKRGSTFYVHFTDLAGNRQRLSTGESLEDRARIKALDLMREQLTGSADEATRKALSETVTLSMQLRDTYEDLWRGQKSAKEKLYLIRALARDVGHWPIHAINYPKLRDYCKQLEERGDAPATRNRKMSAIQTALKEAVKMERLSHLPVFPHFAENNTKDRILEDHEETKLLAWLDANTAPADTERAFLRHLVVFLLDTGCRASEGLGMSPARDRGRSVHLPDGTTKNGRGRQLPLTRRARAALDAMLASPHLGQVDADWAGRRFRTVMEKAGIEGITLHTLRHTCASRLLRRGASLHMVSEWLGHSTLEMTKRYAHWAVDNFIDARNLLEEPVPNYPATFADAKSDPMKNGTHSVPFGSEISHLGGAKGETRSLSEPDGSST